MKICNTEEEQKPTRLLIEDKEDKANMKLTEIWMVLLIEDLSVHLTLIERLLANLYQKVQLEIPLNHSLIVRLNKGGKEVGTKRKDLEIKVVKEEVNNKNLVTISKEVINNQEVNSNKEEVVVNRRDITKTTMIRFTTRMDL
jgi:hypothetical protein